MLTKGVLPIIGPRTPEQLTDNLAALDVSLSSEQVERLDLPSAVPIGFPHDVIAGGAASLAGGRAGLIDAPTGPVREAAPGLRSRAQSVSRR